MDKKTTDINEQPARVFSIKHKKSGCLHKTVTLDMESRQVICDQCERMIDPFDFLFSNAVEESSALACFMHLLREKQKLEAEVSRLKKQKVFLTSQKSKHNGH
jgi:ribosomal protein S27E